MRRTRLYFHLASSGIRKNRKLYFPYILTCIGMVMMFYILHSLSYAPALRQMEGGNNVELVLSLGKIVIAVFSALFLFYTNSFLIRRRYKEFGLYNVLGMDKKALCQVVLWESLIVAVTALGLGITFGIVFSKLAELGLVNVIHGKVDYSITVSWECILITLYLMGVIFLLLTVKSLLQVWLSKPMELLRSENFGEKPPKANYLFALAGLLILGAAYYLAVSIHSPLKALVLFFVAVIMVIIATYLLFIAGSVALCRILQRNKSYYYQKRHFVSVATMVYRMKRNGAGLASICILATMVLVMISSTSSLYIGADDAISARYPNDICFSVVANSLNDLCEENAHQLRETLLTVPAENGVAVTKTVEYQYTSIVALQEDNALNPDSSTVDASLDLVDNLRQLYFLKAEDFNAIMGTGYSVAPGEAIISPLRCVYTLPELNMGDLHLTVIGTAKEVFPLNEAQVIAIPSIFVLIHDFSELTPIERLADYNGNRMMILHAFFGCDLDADDAAILDIYDQQEDLIPTIPFLQSENGIGWSSGCPAGERNDFYTTFGGLFFLGIVLSIVFIAATVLIIYYKQISEGYEDQARFAIMQKVGMTRQDIRASINSQILTVFFAPLLMAGLHLIFAFPIVWKLLQLFSLHNIRIIIATTIGSFLVFSLLYAIVYRLTAGAYYHIVSGAKAE